MLLPRVLLRPTASPALLPLLLSMRPTEPVVGTVHTGTVTRIETYGAFCSLEGVRRDGLLHISQMDPDGKRVPSVASVVSIGDRLRVRVKSLEDGKIGLTVQGVTQPAGSRMRAQYEQSAAGLDALGPPPTAEELERLPSLSLSFTRSSGSGGQNVNKLSTRCEARLQLADCPWPRGVLERMRRHASGGGVVSVACESHRTQKENRRGALVKLAALVREAWRPPKVRRQRTGISTTTKRVRREGKRRAALKKQVRVRVRVS